MTWIACEDQMPEENHRYLCYDAHFGTVIASYYIRDSDGQAIWQEDPVYNQFYNLTLKGVTHWQSLPDKPLIYLI